MFGLKLALMVGAAAVAFAAGWKVDEWRHAAADVKAAVHTIKTVQAQGQVSTVAAAKDAEVQTSIRYVTRTLIEKVPAHVSPETDRSFPLPVGLVRVHDAAALGVDVSAVPDPAGRADDQASAVEASDLGRVLAVNYGECRADQARLSALQGWVSAEAMPVAP
ncbi:MAG: putative signal peptide protein [Phenylobacterium sp.]|nr:putative signal peptide protein [Phenylobacterium sp.]